MNRQNFWSKNLNLVAFLQIKGFALSCDPIRILGPSHSYDCEFNWNLIFFLKKLLKI